MSKGTASIWTTSDVGEGRSQKMNKFSCTSFMEGISFTGNNFQFKSPGTKTGVYTLHHLQRFPINENYQIR